MARKILVDSSDLIDSWYNKVDTMSDYIEDLDDLDTTFQPGNTWSVNPNYPIDRDSNVVSATNYIMEYANNITNSYINGSITPIQSLSAKLIILADSSQVFDKLTVQQLWNYDSAMTLAYSDPTWYGDSPGTSKFDYNADVSTFGTLSVTKIVDETDSGVDFGKVTLAQNGSGFIGAISTTDSTSTVLFKSLRTSVSQNKFLIDSAYVLDRITVSNFISDSGDDSGINITSATVGHAAINNLTIASDSSLTFTAARQFLMTDSNRNNIFAAYLLDSS